MADGPQPMDAAQPPPASALGNGGPVGRTGPPLRSRLEPNSAAGYDATAVGEPRRPFSTGPGRSWLGRAEGDRRARGRLRVLEGKGTVLLNDRRVVGSKSRIPLIAVSSAGVFVIDTMSGKGLVHTKRPGPIADLGQHELHVGRRNCTFAVEQVAGQMRAVRASLQSTPWGSEVPVHAMLCLIRAQWGFASAIQLTEVWVGWPKLLADRVHAPGILDSPTVGEVSAMIADHLPLA